MSKRRPLSTAKVRIAAVSDREADCVHPDSFDTWLDQERAGARREGQVEALREAAEQARKRDAALQAVLDLHVGATDGCCDECPSIRCAVCEEWAWPCLTVRAIHDALGEES